MQLIWSYVIYLGLNSHLSTKPLLIIPTTFLLPMLCLASFVILGGLGYQDLEMVSIIENKIGKQLPLLRQLIALGTKKDNNP
jgi:hypothetical protein